MDDQRDYEEEAANRRLMDEQKNEPIRSMFVTGCVCEGDECGGHNYRRYRNASDRAGVVYDPPVVTVDDQQRGRAMIEQAADQLGVDLGERP